MIRLLVADDSEVIRYGLQALLSAEPDLTIIAMADNGQSAIDLAAADPPDVILMDLSMPILDGIAATRQITATFPHIRILVLSSYSDETIVREAFAAGAHGYLLKDTPPDALIDAIRAIHRGDSPKAPVVLDILGT